MCLWKWENLLVQANNCSTVCPQVVLRGELQQTEEKCRELREELSRVRNEAMQLQGTKVRGHGIRSMCM